MRDQRELLVLVGRNGVGKDFFAETIRASKPPSPGIDAVRLISFGDAVKNSCMEIYPWIPRNYFYDSSLKDVVFDHPNNRLGKTPRQIIHHISSSLQHIDPEVFTRRTLYDFGVSYASTNALHIITDMRIQREFDAVCALRVQGVKVTIIKILDGTEVSSRPRDFFEAWTDEFAVADFTFMNKQKNGPGDVLAFVRRFKIC